MGPIGTSASAGGLLKTPDPDQPGRLSQTLHGGWEMLGFQLLPLQQLSTDFYALPSTWLLLHSEEDIRMLREEGQQEGCLLSTGAFTASLPTRLRTPPSLMP